MHVVSHLSPIEQSLEEERHNKPIKDDDTQTQVLIENLTQRPIKHDVAEVPSRWPRPSFALALPSLLHTSSLPRLCARSNTATAEFSDAQVRLQGSVAVAWSPAQVPWSSLHSRTGALGSPAEPPPSCRHCSAPKMAAPIALEEGQASANVEETSSEERQRRQQLEECEEGWRRLKDQILELQKMTSLMKRRSRLPALRQMLRLPGRGMKSALKKSAVLYHYPCPDGAFAALAARLYFSATSLPVLFVPNAVYDPIRLKAGNADYISDLRSDLGNQLAIKSQNLGLRSTNFFF
ncbi:hypothetical protein B296_00032593 [Ensete ventricosum]|uniref:Uncharacterized protein n=1 Tax=Ensete ventricosum TaxID=4639 RepID=A0A426YH97_ENSVE|nr:hypothetical protein B296_00032593 [Ensete ventricosum]